jgi:hypothetical protein
MDAMALLQAFMEVAHMNIEIVLAIEPQHMLYHRQRHASWAGLPGAAVEEPIVALPLISVFPAAHGTRRNPQDRSRLNPVELSLNGLPNHLLHLHRSLRRGP